MIVDAILAGLIFYFTFPLLTGYCAFQYGRNFWGWFALGCLFPIVSFIVLVGIIVFDEKSTPVNKLTKREKAESNEMVSELIKDIGSSRPKNSPSKKQASKQGP